MNGEGVQLPPEHTLNIPILFQPVRAGEVNTKLLISSYLRKPKGILRCRKKIILSENISSDKRFSFYFVFIGTTLNRTYLILFGLQK